MCCICIHKKNWLKCQTYGQNGAAIAAFDTMRHLRDHNRKHPNWIWQPNWHNTTSIETISKHRLPSPTFVPCRSVEFHLFTANFHQWCSKRLHSSHNRKARFLRLVQIIRHRQDHRHIPAHHHNRRKNSTTYRKWRVWLARCENRLRWVRDRFCARNWWINSKKKSYYTDDTENGRTIAATQQHDRQWGN